MTRMYFLVAAWLCAVIPGATSAGEPWTEPTAKLPPGVVLWLDAGRQAAAWQAHGRQLGGGALLDVWYDGSGNNLNLVQRVQTAQPRWRQVGPHAVVRFDGKDDFLGLAGLKRSLKDCTLFLVAVPRSNAGMFRGLFAVNETGKNDYTTGFNVDFTGFGSAAFDGLNVEGRGFGGAVNLLRGSHPFGGSDVIEVRCEPGQVAVALDGKAQGTRKRTPADLSMEQIVLGARCYSNTGEPPFITGFFDGDIAEVILFDRALKAEESRAVTEYLRKRYADLDQHLAKTSGGHLLEVVADPPPVQMLLPGFTVKQLPIDLPHVNNLLYRPDGKLIALGYNGNVYVLSDRDGDGLEEHVEVFWKNEGQLVSAIGMDLTPPGYDKGDGVFVASKGKISLIVDTDKDGKADKEIAVADGWTPLPHGVDALGVAVAKDGSVYYGMGTTNFTNAYLIEKGTAKYGLTSERGTIMKVSPDFKKRAIVATGIRFPVGLRFNHAGDLFCTDQEGATWLPNGNPLDELLHIQPGRHYGFPPRHPKHLPGVIDEPSTFDYGPQHQSTCGLNFNHSPGKTFGPEEWAGAAIVCGYSRGKLYRTKLVKAHAGYVAQTQIIGCLNALTVDACVSPQGELVIATHSGPPDWGTGPAGKGKLFKVFYDPKTPTPLFAYPTGPGEVHVAFNQPLDPALLKDVAKQAVIEYGPFVRPGDRFEKLKPPYAIVQQQGQTPRHKLAVLGASITPDRRTLIVQTAPHPYATHYALRLPGLGRAAKSQAGALPQLPDVELGYDLSGVQAEWTGGGGERWSGWLPHWDLEVAQALTRGSAEHDRLWNVVSKEKGGPLQLRTRLDLWDMLRPAVQPGAAIDYQWPEETVTIQFDRDGPLRVESKVPYHDRQITLQPRKRAAVDVALSMPGAMLRTSWHTAEDKRPRALPLHRLLVPWARQQDEPVLAQRIHPDLEGGNWAKGRALYFGDAAQCSRCHLHHGQGGKIGPDLTNLVHRDYDSVLRDVRFPNATLNPDHLSYVVSTIEGKVLLGALRTDGEQVIVGTNEGKEHRLAKFQIESLRPSPVSTMPEGIDKKLSPGELRDLLTFLLTEPLKPAPLEREGAPPPRSRAEIDAILKTREPLPKELRKVHVVLAAGPKDHGPGEHDYPLWQRRWLNLLSLAENVQVSTFMGWPTAKQWETADVIVFYSHHAGWSGERAKDLDAFLAKGGGLVYVHFAVEGHKHADVLAQRIGLAWGGGRARFRHGAVDLSFPDPKHPITRGFSKVRFLDESYWQLTGDPKSIHVLATGIEDKAPQPLLWTAERGEGRVFVSILGHYTWTFDDPLFRILMLRGIAWAGREPADRWLDLATVGARVGE